VFLKIISEYFKLCGDIFLFFMRKPCILFKNAISSQRRSLLGSGDRSEKICTYNWPQNRVTDHRLEGENKNFNLDKVVEGDIVGLIEALMIADNAERMKGEIGEEA
jgi:protein subunit release factor A